MNDKLRIPDAETRARSIANLREAGRLLDLCTLDLDEVIAALDKDLRAQSRARLLHKSKSTPTI
ncbi:hypothetical protein [Chamaesiphon sp. VAR_48_metabat_135_sub]|uniref:hypothetical protein n=1 Tax=Chamaesiphon sp. VAR_48_metabat_135_sub TaxID=2964699 RepID=UPI00286AEEBE|nr:hypothetical protein [Chamaesiphon sp. VAR_48_metabat_135_sub]